MSEKVKNIHCSSISRFSQTLYSLVSRQIMSKVEFGLYPPPQTPLWGGVDFFLEVIYMYFFWKLLFKPKQVWEVCRSENKIWMNRETFYREFKFFSFFFNSLFSVFRQFSAFFFLQNWNFFLKTSGKH